MDNPKSARVAADQSTSPERPGSQLGNPNSRQSAPTMQLVRAYQHAQQLETSITPSRRAVAPRRYPSVVASSTALRAGRAHWVTYVMHSHRLGPCAHFMTSPKPRTWDSTIDQALTCHNYSIPDFDGISIRCVDVLMYGRGDRDGSKVLLSGEIRPPGRQSGPGQSSGHDCDKIPRFGRFRLPDYEHQHGRRPEQRHHVSNNCERPEMQTACLW